MVDLGRIGFLPKGEWDPTINYEILDVVFEDNATYIALKNSINKRPSTNPSSWQFVCSNPLEDSYVHKTDYATTNSAGTVKIDGITLQTDNNGVLSCKEATTNTLGAVMPDDSTLGVTYNGVVFIKAEYTRKILNGIASKADELRLDEGTSKLQLLSDGTVLSEVSFAEFKGESYILTEEDKNYIAQLILSSIGVADTTAF